ncbi:hypothetical protein Hdeb2414_s0002g00044051 [Helianthus debilis subsp. tardiflorus]
MAKKLWSLMRVLFFMLKKGISKAKIFADLNMMIKHGKITEKSLPGEYEFSCSNTPSYPLKLFSNKKNKHKHPQCDMTPLDENNDIFINAKILKTLEMLTSATASPVFGKSQLRIMDSPFSLSNGEEDGQVDEAADKFIMRFYSDLRRQTT